MGERINEVKNGNEPGMQADQWGEAGRAADGVRSNGPLDSASGLLNILCMFLLLGGRPNTTQKIRKMFTTSAQIEVLQALSASTLSVMRQRVYALRFLALFSCFIHRAISAKMRDCPQHFHMASAFSFDGGTDRI